MSNPTQKKKTPRTPAHCPFCGAPTAKTMAGRVICQGASVSGCGITVTEVGDTGKLKLGVHY